MKKLITGHPAYRKIVSELRDCEDRYGKLHKSIKGGEDGQLEAAVNALRDEVVQRRKLEAKLLTAVEEERQRIGQDLHDDLCQRLGAAALLTSSLVKQIKVAEPHLRAELEKIPGLINDTIESCRDLARGLHPVTLADKGLPAALEELASRVPRGIKFNWSHSARIALMPSVALHLYRIAEEALGNAIKHSRATSIAIELDVIDGHLVLVISDNGKGFDKGVKSKGMGLNNMRYRCSVIDGDFSIGEEKNGGTRVRCCLPFPDGAKRKAARKLI